MMNQEGTSLIVANKNHKKPTRSDLVYFEESPDYCVQDSEIGGYQNFSKAYEPLPLTSRLPYGWNLTANNKLHLTEVRDRS